MNDEIARAIQSAKYNESVQVVVNDEEGNSYEISLIPSLDEENGGIQWNSLPAVNASSELSSDAEENIRRHLRTKRWIFPMLNDHRRNELYAKAIECAAEQVANRIRSYKGDDNNATTTPTGNATHVQCLDIGSGTGLLAMLSAKCLTEKVKAYSVHVTTLEMSSAMAKIARATVASNTMQDVISIVAGHSCEIPPLQPKALFCTSELLESGLLGEGWIPAIRDAWERHLDPMAVVVPQGAKVYAQIVEGPGIFSFWGPHQKLTGFPNGRALSLSLTRDSSQHLLGGTGVQVRVHIQHLFEDTENPIRVLSDPVEVLEIRVDSKEHIPTAEGQIRSTTIVPTASGVGHGLVFWWELNLLGDDLLYNTMESPWQDHWQQCIFAFATQPEECPRVNKGEPMTIQATHNDYSLSFTILPDDQDDCKSKRLRGSTTDNAGLVSPQRAWQLNDLSRSATIRDGMQGLLKEKGFDAVILDVSDFSLCAMIAALLGASNVWSLEAGSSNLADATARIAQVANELPLSREGDSDSNMFQILRCHPEQVSRDVLGGSQVDIVVAEPYYEILEGWALQEALNFLYILRGLKRRGVVRPDVLTMPLYAKILGCAFESANIGNGYSKCDMQLCGMLHEVINDYHALSDHDVSLPSWQYDISPLSDPFEIATLDYTTCAIHCNENATSEIHFVTSGTCHGMLVWIEYGIPSANPNSTVITLSTQRRSHYQTIRLLKEPIHDIDHRADAFFCKATFGRCDERGDDVSFEISVERHRKIPPS